MNKELETNLRGLYKERGDLSIDLAMPWDMLSQLFDHGLTDLILCDGGRHTSTEIAYRLFQRRIGAVALRGGLAVIDDMVNFQDVLLSKLSKIIITFPHVSVPIKGQLCYELHEQAVELLFSKSRDLQFYDSNNNLILAIENREKS